MIEGLVGVKQQVALCCEKNGVKGWLEIRRRRWLDKEGMEGVVTYFESDWVEETGKDAKCRVAAGDDPRERETPRRRVDTRTERARRQLEALHELRSMMIWGEVLLIKQQCELAPAQLRAQRCVCARRQRELTSPCLSIITMVWLFLLVQLLTAQHSQHISTWWCSTLKAPTLASLHHWGMNVVFDDAGQGHLVRVLKQIFPDENILIIIQFWSTLITHTTATQRQATKWGWVPGYKQLSRAWLLVSWVTFGFWISGNITNVNTNSLLTSHQDPHHYVSTWYSNVSQDSYIIRDGIYLLTIFHWPDVSPLPFRLQATGDDWQGRNVSSDTMLVGWYQRKVLVSVCEYHDINWLQFNCYYQEHQKWPAHRIHFELQSCACQPSYELF